MNSLKQAQKSVATIVALKEQRKTIEQAISAELDTLLKNMCVGQMLEVDDDCYELYDIFEKGNTTFRPACIHRFDIREVKA